MKDRTVQNSQAQDFLTVRWRQIPASSIQYTDSEGNNFSKLKIQSTEVFLEVGKEKKKRKNNYSTVEDGHNRVPELLLRLQEFIINS